MNKFKLKNYRAHTIRIRLAELNALIVDTTQPPASRKAIMLKVIDEVLTTVGESSNTKENSKKFLLHVAWHEGDKLTTRKQYKGGPARSFYQFEAWRAKDDFEQGILPDKKKLSILAKICVQSEDSLKSAFKQISAKDKAYPANNLIGLLMESDDHFATCLARYSLMRYPDAIPTTNEGHANYWFDHWKGTLIGGSEGDIEALKEKFITASNEVDAV